ncbi:hypothetical protein [Tenacibaculum jejuense]|uniref:Probable lipoprotein n=1 Tax=Tenacibaculum jejuense TaxID=584609 RepID=A0A238U8H2_9FLAO|nr:hypothetical protein [Tenacibaculum jejuense]SNR15493.1 Probable lipoprotein precursor [Tenacibaculum jejuense]
MRTLNFKCKQWIILVLISLSIVSCSDTDEKTNPGAQAIGLIENSNKEFSGKISIDNSKIAYGVIQNSELNYTISVNINNKEITAVVDYENSTIDFKAADVQFSDMEKVDLLMSTADIAEYFLEEKEAKIDMHEYAMIKLMEYWSQAPSQHVFHSRKVNSDLDVKLRSRNEGITCIRRNSYVKAEYDDRNGRSYSDNVKVGSKPRANYGCMGRCGADCGRWWIPSAWTKDCMDHDQCSNIFNASGGSSDPNCGDEFNEAADDYVFGVLRGCRG